ncbi:hypothetical protein GGX14DRAFT_643187 [Mycena pura]|uniref:Uncharacterized protein n=1 Tax=Mycena pura TaxID=153505 RepID=A0AAD6V8N6_9AGAR|nr:hypothetical protein GGX14DRAFT_643187 [Mycena pura]
MSVTTNYCTAFGIHPVPANMSKKEFEAKCEALVESFLALPYIYLWCHRGAGHTPIPRTAGLMQWVALLITFVNNEACSCIAFVKGGPHACIALDNAEPHISKTTPSSFPSLASWGKMKSVPKTGKTGKTGKTAVLGQEGSLVFCIFDKMGKTENVFGKTNSILRRTFMLCFKILKEVLGQLKKSSKRYIFILLDTFVVGGAREEDVWRGMGLGMGREQRAGARARGDDHGVRGVREEDVRRGPEPMIRTGAAHTGEIRARGGAPWRRTKGERAAAAGARDRDGHGAHGGDVRTTRHSSRARGGAPWRCLWRRLRRARGGRAAGPERQALWEAGAGSREVSGADTWCALRNVGGTQKLRRRWARGRRTLLHDGCDRGRGGTTWEKRQKNTNPQDQRSRIKDERPSVQDQRRISKTQDDFPQDKDFPRSVSKTKDSKDEPAVLLMQACIAFDNIKVSPPVAIVNGETRAQGGVGIKISYMGMGGGGVPGGLKFFSRVMGKGKNTTFPDMVLFGTAGPTGPPQGWETPSLYGRRGGEGGPAEVEKKLSTPYPIFESRGPLARARAARVIGVARVHITFVTGKARAHVAFDTGKVRTCITFDNNELRPCVAADSGEAHTHAAFVTDEACCIVHFPTHETRQLPKQAARLTPAKSTYRTENIHSEVPLHPVLLEKIRRHLSIVKTQLTRSSRDHGSRARAERRERRWRARSATNYSQTNIIRVLLFTPRLSQCTPTSDASRCLTLPAARARYRLPGPPVAPRPAVCAHVPPTRATPAAYLPPHAHALRHALLTPATLLLIAPPLHTSHRALRPRACPASAAAACTTRAIGARRDGCTARDLPAPPGVLPAPPARSASAATACTTRAIAMGAPRALDDGRLLSSRSALRPPPRRAPRAPSVRAAMGAPRALDDGACGPPPPRAPRAPSVRAAIGAPHTLDDGARAMGAPRALDDHARGARERPCSVPAALCVCRRCVHHAPLLQAARSRITPRK